MDFYINSTLAQKYGIKEAIVLDVIDEELFKREEKNAPRICGKCFLRMSAKMLSAKVPMLTVSSANRVLKHLVDAGILASAELNATPFDRTRSYTFTDYGECVMDAAYVGK